MMPPSSMADALASLLTGHGVEAVVLEDMVHLPQPGLWASLWMEAAQPGTFLFELRATTRGEAVVVDRWAGVGSDVEEGKRDGLLSFCRGTFHVLLAAVWGVLERDQVDHCVWWVDGREWDLYFGPCTMRQSLGVAPLVLPPSMVDRVMDQFQHHLTAGEVHAARLYLAVVNGQITVEALVDDVPSPKLQEAFQGAGWSLPANGFASLRWFLAASPRVGGPTHRIERNCQQ